MGSDTVGTDRQQRLVKYFTWFRKAASQQPGDLHDLFMDDDLYREWADSYLPDHDGAPYSVGVASHEAQGRACQYIPGFRV